MMAGGRASKEDSRLEESLARAFGRRRQRCMHWQAQAALDAARLKIKGNQADQRVCSKCPIEFKFERIRGYKMARLEHVVRPRNEIRESLKSQLKLSKAAYSYARSIKFNPGVQKMRTSVLN